MATLAQQSYKADLPIYAQQVHLDFEQVGNQGKRVIVFDQETAGFIVSGRAYPSSYPDKTLEVGNDTNQRAAAH